MPIRALEVWIAGVLLLAGGDAVGAVSSPPIAVSPGAVDDQPLIAETCPTFSWAGPSGAAAYEFVLYELVAGHAAEAPLFRIRLPGSASSWTPSLEHCVRRGGTYAWTLRALRDGGESEWSQPALFRVAVPAGRARLARALDVLERYRAVHPGAGDSGAAASPGSPEATWEPPLAETSPVTTITQESGELTVAGDLVATDFLIPCTEGDSQGRWTAGNGHCYMEFASGASWPAAAADCRDRGGYLATLTSAAENDFVLDMGGSGSWIGGSDARSESFWEWITGEVAVNGQDGVYEAWKSGEPNDFGTGEDCMRLFVEGWDDRNCANVYSYVCERDF